MKKQSSFTVFVLLVVFSVFVKAEEKLGTAAQAMQDYVVEIRRQLHQIPELRWEEEKTLAFIAGEIDKLIRKYNLDLQVKNATGGFWVDVPGKTPLSKRILIRADVDALPIKEATGLPFASQIDGRMHACGHDSNAAMALGALVAILEGRVQSKNNLRFVFQRAEENPITESGGARLVKEGVLEGVDEVYGLHVWVNAPAGQFLSRPGPMLANSDRINMVVRCTGGHVAMPHRGSNAIDIATDIHVALRGFDRRLLGAVEPCSLVPAVSNSGTASNVRPSQANLWYAARNFLNEARRAEFADAIKKRVEAVVGNYPDARLEAYDYVRGHPATINTPESVDRVNGLLQSSGMETATSEMELGGDDFAYYLQGSPGSYWFLGAHQEGSGDHHSPTFNPDESVLWKGVLFWLVLATN